MSQERPKDVGKARRGLCQQSEQRHYTAVVSLVGGSTRAANDAGASLTNGGHAAVLPASPPLTDTHSRVHCCRCDDELPSLLLKPETLHCCSHSGP